MWLRIASIDESTSYAPGFNAILAVAVTLPSKIEFYRLVLIFFSRHCTIAAIPRTAASSSGLAVVLDRARRGDIC